MMRFRFLEDALDEAPATVFSLAQTPSCASGASSSAPSIPAKPSPGQPRATDPRTQSRGGGVLSFLHHGPLKVW